MFVCSNINSEKPIFRTHAVWDAPHDFMSGRSGVVYIDKSHYRKQNQTTDVTLAII